jgi:hypothetical protein
VQGDYVLANRPKGVPKNCWALEHIDHSLSVRAWAMLLWAGAPRLFADPPLPPQPCPTSLALEDRLLLYRARVRAGFLPTHPADPPVPELAGVDMTDVPAFLKRLVGRH